MGAYPFTDAIDPGIALTADGTGGAQANIAQQQPQNFQQGVNQISQQNQWQNNQVQGGYNQNYNQGGNMPAQHPNMYNQGQQYMGAQG